MMMTQRMRLLQNRKSKSGITWLKKRMKDLLGSYAESNYDALSLIPYAPTAMDRARRMDSIRKIAASVHRFPSLSPYGKYYW